MAVRKFKPVTPGQRNKVISGEISVGSAEKERRTKQPG